MYHRQDIKNINFTVLNHIYLMKETNEERAEALENCYFNLQEDSIKTEFEITVLKDVLDRYSYIYNNSEFTNNSERLIKLIIKKNELLADSEKNKNLIKKINQEISFILD